MNSKALIDAEISHEEFTLLSNKFKKIIIS